MITLQILFVKNNWNPGTGDRESSLGEKQNNPTFYIEIVTRSVCVCNGMKVRVPILLIAEISNSMFYSCYKYTII